MDVTANINSVRDVVALAAQAGVPVPTFSSAIAYFDSYRAEKLPANLIQAQRDTLGRIRMSKDKEGIYHILGMMKNRISYGKRILLVENEKN